MSANPITMPGDVLSPSQVGKFFACSAAWHYKYVERLPDPRTGAFAVGSAVHAAIAANLTQKIETKTDLPVAGVVAVFRDSWGQIQEGTEYRDDENPAELAKMGEALAVLHAEQAAPYIDPAAVELPVMGRIGGVLVRGFVDLLTVDGTIIDTKTAARKPSDVSSSQRFQVGTYRQLAPGANGQGCIQTLTKTKSPALVTQDFTISESDLVATERLYPLAQAGMRSGFYAPNRGDMFCSRRGCSFWRACQRDFGGTVSE